jgi:DNA-binding response OmpR family regulator
MARTVAADPVILMEYGTQPCRRVQTRPMHDLCPVLLVEDDPVIAKTLGMSLRYQGFELTVAGSIREALQQVASRSFNLIMLDVGLPDGSGIGLCRTLRQRDENVPILMLTARSDEQSAIAGIDSGADDYIRKPYSLGELTARLNRLLARAYKPREQLAFGALSMDIQRRSASVEGRALQLGKREFDILAVLVGAQGDTITRERLLAALGHDDDGVYDRTIDSHLSHIRAKLKKTGATLRIVAVYGVGYRLETL